MADRVWKGVYLLVFGCSRQLSLNNFFDPRSRSIRKVCDREEEEGEVEEKNGENNGSLTSLPVDRLNGN